MSDNNEWVPIMKAAYELGINIKRLSMLVKDNNIPFRTTVRDRRIKLVNINQLRDLFNDKLIIEVNDVQSESTSA